MTKNKLWGGRFTKKTNELVESFSNSIHFDYKLAACDCMGSLVHIEILKRAKLLTNVEHSKLKKGLNKILSKFQNSTIKIDATFEDIHSYIQHLLEKDKNVGKVALKLHTCRSRNDQVVFDTKLYCLYSIFRTNQQLEQFSKALKKLAEKNKNIFMPGYTHLQHAMPISLGKYFLAYVEMLERDEKKLLNAFNNINLTLGAGALAGTFIESSQYYHALENFLGAKKLVIQPSANSIDAVSDRDFIIEILSVLSIVAMHLSRLSEDMILWSTQEFNFLEIDDAFCTGSSLMPQKKNPDVLELVRGYAGRIYGNLTNVLVMMKGLPLSYNRDMQHDKEPLFDSFEIIQAELEVLTELFGHVSFNKDSIQKQLGNECLYATDMADYLVQNGIAFKTAHSIIGQLIQEKYRKNISFLDMDDSTLKNIHPLLTSKVMKSIICPKTSVNAKKSTRAKRRRKK